MKGLKKNLGRILVSSLGTFLAVMAGVFANMQCQGRLYEPKLPDKLRK